MLYFVLSLLLWLSFFLVIYHHFLYPLLIKILAKKKLSHTLNFKNWRCYQEQKYDTQLPSISIVVPAYNEEKVIAEKILNIAALDYPNDKFKLVIICDGCTDKTELKIKSTLSLAECQHLTSEIISHPSNRGKIAVLNDIVPQLTSDIIMLTDASTMTSVDALLIAAHHFESPVVGVIYAYYKLLTKINYAEDLYWRYQAEIKLKESLLGGTIGGHGPCYLIRRELFEPLENDIINDDVVIPMKIVIQGYKSIYEPSIMALEMEATPSSNDFKRRQRLAAGNIQQIIRQPEILKLKSGLIGFIFFSNKFLRALMPFCLLAIFFSSLILSITSTFALFLFIAQVVFYSLAFMRFKNKITKFPKILDPIYYFSLGHLATLVGEIKYFRGNFKHGWKKIQ